MTDKTDTKERTIAEVIAQKVEEAFNADAMEREYADCIIALQGWTINWHEAHKDIDIATRSTVVKLMLSAVEELAGARDKSLNQKTKTVKHLMTTAVQTLFVIESDNEAPAYEDKDAPFALWAKEHGYTIEGLQAAMRAIAGGFVAVKVFAPLRIE